MPENEQEKADAATESKEDAGQQQETDYKSKYIYLLAEMDNYRKARDKELSEYIKYANEKLITDMLKVLDDFDGALKTGDDKVKLLLNSLVSVLRANGLKRLDVVGKDYSPEIAEAVSTEKMQDKSGKIIEEIQPGYVLNGKIIRYPKVKVAI
jgi:molecular chaperone GrpE